MTEIQYAAKITKDKDDSRGYYNVSFPDVPGCLTYGQDIDHAKKMAKEALEGVLMSLDSRSKPIPFPQKKSGRDIYYIKPAYHIAMAVKLRLIREKMKLSQEELAKKMSVTTNAYQKYERISKANLTLKTIEKIEKAIGIKLIEV